MKLVFGSVKEIVRRWEIDFSFRNFFSTVKTQYHAAVCMNFVLLQTKCTVHNREVSIL